MTRRTELRRALLRTSRLMQLLHVEQFTRAAPASAWMPAVNVYRYPRHYELVVELAGVEPGDVRIEVDDERRIRITGTRHWPPLRCAETGASCQATSILEIEDGSFAREITVAEHDRIGGVEVEFRTGLVWIRALLKEVARD